LSRPLTRLKKFRLGTRDRRQGLPTGELRSLAVGSFNASQAKRFDKAIFDEWPIEGFFNTIR